MRRALAACAAGLCDEQELRRRTVDAWDRADWAQTPAATQSGFMAWEQPLLPWLPRGRRIGIVGCGTGRELLALSALGYEADGLDSSTRAIAAVQAFLDGAGIAAAVRGADIAEAGLPRPPYGAIVFSWLTYGYILGRPRRIAALARARAQLDPGGAVLISYIPRSDGTGARFRRVANAVAWLTGSGFRLMPGDVFDDSTLSYERHFTFHELADEAAEAGLQAEPLDSDAAIGLALLRVETARP